MSDRGGGLSGLAVRRGVTFAMVFLIVVGFGLFSLARLRLDLYPDVTFPMIGVVTTYEGAGPEEIEELVTRPIESTVTAVEGVKHVTSESKRGASVVMIEFDWEADLDQAEIDVRKYIDFIRDLLPEDTTDPVVFAFDPSLQPILFLGLSGPYDEVELRRIAEERIEPLLERLPGVASVDTMGGGKREIKVELDMRRLGAAAISPSQVVSALRANNVMLPGGSFKQGGWEFNVQADGRFTSVREIEHVVVGLRGTVPVRVRDVARVIDGQQERTRIVRNNGQPGIMVMARKQSDANTVQAVRHVLRALPEVERQAGRGVKLAVIFNQADFIEQAIGNLSSTALVAFAMAFLVLLFFLRDLRSSLIVASAIPLSVIATFSIMDAAGLTLNVLSMAGLALAIGMLVDNSIVVLENIFSFTDRGASPRRAAVRGSNEVGTAITASTLTTVVVFLPILFVPGIAGKLFNDMSVTICFSLAASLAVARTGIPLAASRLLQRRGGARRAGFVSAAIGRLLDGVRASYMLSLGWSLRHRKKTLAAALLVFVGVMAVGSRVPTDFFPKEDQSLIMMQLDVAEGSALETTDAVFRQVERIVEQHVPEREAMNVDLGSGEGFIALFSKGAHSGILRLKLKSMRQRRRSQQQIEADLRRRLAEIPGLTANVLEGGPFGAGGDISVEIYGHDLVVARRLGMQVKRLLQRVPHTADVTFSMEAGRPEYRVKLDRSRLAALGLSTAEVAATLSVLYSGKVASVFREGGTEHDIRVRAPRAFRDDVRDLESVLVRTATGKSVPLSAIATVAPSVGPTSIARKDQQRMVTVSCTVTGNNLGQAVKRVNAELAALRWPAGFSHHVGGKAEDFKESFQWLGLALLASIVLVYMVMASQFESLLHPFLILFSIPLAFVGVVLALLVTGTSLSVMALIGVLVLAGVVVNNAIVFVDTINQNRAAAAAGEGGAEAAELARLMPPRVPAELGRAVLEAGQRRLRPILMTATTTMLGMLPLALEIGEGAESWSPMARSVIGGLMSSTLLTLVVIPTFYTSVEAWRAARRARRAARREAAEA